MEVTEGRFQGSKERRVTEGRFPESNSRRQGHQWMDRYPYPNTPRPCRPLVMCEDASCLARPLTESLRALRVEKPFDRKSPGARRIAQVGRPSELHRRESRAASDARQEATGVTDGRSPVEMNPRPSPRAAHKGAGGKGITEGRFPDRWPFDGKPLGIDSGEAFQWKVSRRTLDRSSGGTFRTGPERIEISDRLRPRHTRGRSASGTDRAASDQPRRGEEPPAWRTQTQRALGATKSHESGADGEGRIMFPKHPSDAESGCDVSWDSERQSDSAERRSRLD